MPSQPTSGVQSTTVAGLVRHMHAIDDYRRLFERLQSSWDTLTLLGQLSGNATDMSSTRQAFEALTGTLIEQLAGETRDKAVAELRTKAQALIDLLVRNLFERTADIGFLSADADIVSFLGSDRSPDRQEAIEARFREYVAKYSVYSDVVLIAAGGEIRARFRKGDTERVMHPALIDALTSSAGYVELYDVVDGLGPDRQLVYAWRVEGAARQPLGVLMLVFRLEDEFAGIFGKLLAPSDWTVLACVAPDGRVVAGSCPIQLPAGFRLPPEALAGEQPTMRLGGRQYIAVLCREASYQGYAGPGWVGLGLLPIEAAFDDTAREGTEIDDRLLAGATSGSALFSNELRQVSRQAAAIQAELNRAVWNGSTRLSGSTTANADFGKILLWEISKIGGRTQSAFDASISDLHRTVVAALLDKCRGRAAFAVDVLDRNLYERANDCRWWALDASLASALARPGPETARAAADTLAMINRLYTVYTNLILFDANGRIVAVSQPAESGLVGERIEADWARDVLALKSTQSYAVSRFEPSPLYDGVPALVYGAAIRGESGRVLGGVGIVFDSTPQFAAMLRDAMPLGGQGAALPGAFALFVGADGRIVASSDSRFEAGTASPIPVDKALTRGAEARILLFDGQHVAVGIAPSEGYREFKTSDGHHPDMVAICVVPLAPAGAVAAGARAQSASTMAVRLHGAGDGLFEVATFHIGRHWLGIRAEHVIEAVGADGIRPAAREASNGLLAGYILHRDEPLPVLRLARLLGVEEPVAETQIVILGWGARSLGLLVEALGAIPQVTTAQVQPLRGAVPESQSFAIGVIPMTDASGRPTGMVTLMDAERLGDRAGLGLPLRAAE